MMLELTSGLTLLVDEMKPVYHKTDSCYKQVGLVQLGPAVVTRMERWLS